MQKIDAPRDKVRKVVIAAFRRQSDEGARRKRRLCELAGLPYDPQEEMQTQVLLSFMVKPYVDNLTGVISDEECLTKLKDIISKDIGDQIKKDREEPLEDEEEKHLNQTVAAMIDSIFTYVLPPNYQEKGFRYFQYVFELAQEKGIPPRDVFASEELYRDVLRNVYTREEYQANITKGFSFLNPDTILDVFLKPIVESLVEDEEEFAEIYNELKEEMQSNPEMQEKMEALRNAFSQVAEEEMARIYG